MLYMYSVSSMKQQSTDRHVARFEHIITTSNQRVFDLSN